ncbi:MAG TPA: outer membrane beta-barrel protein [Chitinophagaceae bacterium]|nr:outer membrane beta-barrel protein [Chitinophagaceae bacterium]
MRKATFLSVLVFISILSSAQELKWGFFGGPQITSARYIINGEKQPTTAKYGFQLGTNLKVPFDTKLYFSPAVFYSLKGYKVELNQISVPPDSLAIDNNTTIHTVELAALLQYDFNDQPNHFFVKMGPSLDIHVSGKEKFTRSNRTIVEQQMQFSFTRYGYAGANILLLFGYETKSGLQYSVQYTHGIGSVNNADNGPGIWHRAFGITLGKYFR